MGKVGRNDLCQCGSGKKLKKCCLNRDFHKEEQQEEERVLELISKGKKLIYLTNTQILYSDNEENINESTFLKVIEKMKKDKRFIMAPEKDCDLFYPFINIFYLLEDSKQLNSDYNELSNTDFADYINLAKMELDFSKGYREFDYTKAVEYIDKSIVETNWSNMEYAYLIKILLGANITEGVKT